MSTSWKAQIDNTKYAGKLVSTYSIQFETTDKELYRLVEQACQRAMDENDNHEKVPHSIGNGCVVVKREGNP